LDNITVSIHELELDRYRASTLEDAQWTARACLMPGIVDRLQETIEAINDPIVESLRISVSGIIYGDAGQGFRTNSGRVS
jgi:hypothetical protein